MREKRKQVYTGDTITEKLEINRVVDKKERSKTEISQAYRIPLSTLSTYLTNQDSIENQALPVAPVSKRMRICGAKYSDLEDELFEWFCFARSNNIPMEGLQLKRKPTKWRWKLGIEFQRSHGWLQQSKRRPNFTCQAMSGEVSSVYTEASDK
jgi:hypothetical protein